MPPTTSRLVAVLDACVLYGMPLRDTLLRAGEEYLYRPAWSYDIWDEVLRHLRDPKERKRPLTEDDATHLLMTIERHFPEAFVANFESLIPLLTNDTKDRHVAAVAVQAQAQVIVTYNLKHFPPASLAPYGIEAQHPDDFLMDLFDLDPQTMVRIIRQQAAALKKRPTSARQILDKLAQVGVTRFAGATRTRFDAEEAGI
jgi:predicted nucleic acid-binding protein